VFTPILIVDDGLVMPSAAGIRKEDSGLSIVWKACMNDLAFYSSDALAPENGAAKATKRIGIQTATKTNDPSL
jgi:hypothetical protein